MGLHVTKDYAFGDVPINTTRGLCKFMAQSQKLRPAYQINIKQRLIRGVNNILCDETLWASE
jgi:formamidopyrimidine-DNA glycosylase